MKLILAAGLALAAMSGAALAGGDSSMTMTAKPDGHAMMSKDCPAKDGAMKGDAMKDGAMKDGAMKDGAMKGCAAKDGMKDGAMDSKTTDPKMSGQPH